MDDELDNFARGEVLTGRFIRGFRKLTDELLEDQAHGFIGHNVRVEVDVRELLHQLEQQVLVFEFGDAVGKLEALEHVTGVFGEVSEVCDQVLADVLLVGQQARQGEFTGVVKGLLALALEERVQVDATFLALLELSQDLGFRALQHAVKAPQESEGKDDLAVVRLLVVAPEQVGDRPEEVGEFGKILGHEVFFEYR